MAPDGIELYYEALVSISILNKGQRSTQIAAVFVESEGDDAVHLQQIIPDGLPAILDPITRKEVTIQKEWIDTCGDRILSVGALDARGVRHEVRTEQFTALIKRCSELPSRVKKYRRRDDPNAPAIWAFPVKDRATLTSRPKQASK